MERKWWQEMEARDLQEQIHNSIIQQYGKTPKFRAVISVHFEQDKNGNWIEIRTHEEE